MALKLYLDYMSQPCRAIAILLRMHGVTWEEKIVRFATLETRAEWFAKINPMGRIPVMVDGNFQLTESVAILKYLMATRPQIRQEWYPTDVRQRALTDEFIAWQHLGVRRHAALVFIEQALVPFRTGKPVDKEKLEANIRDFEVILNQMEIYFLTRGEFIIGKHPTLADLLAVCELMQAACVGYDFTKDKPKIGAWLENVKARLQPHFDETHREIFEFGAKYRL